MCLRKAMSPKIRKGLKCYRPKVTRKHRHRYVRLTKRMHNLVTNDPYTDSEEKAKRSSSAAKLLRPKDTKPVITNSRKKSEINKR